MQRHEINVNILYLFMISNSFKSGLGFTITAFLGVNYAYREKPERCHQVINQFINTHEVEKTDQQKVPFINLLIL